MPQETVLNHIEISSRSERPTSGPPANEQFPTRPPELRSESELDLIELIRVLRKNKGAVRVFFRHTIAPSSATEA